ncbi:MAG: response regulator transcription factor [Vulcanimicrobiaceae bacterium]
MIRTLVVAPTALARTALAEIVGSDARLSLAGEAETARFSREVRALEPDVVLEERDDTSGVVASASDVPTVALVDDPVAVWANDTARTVALGARAVLARDATAVEIVAAVIAVAAGLIVLAPSALGDAQDDARRDGTAAERLTLRETDVLRELARGAANKTIAARLGVSEHTVKFHVAAIFAKLGVTSRTQAVAHGIRLGLVML